jgi:hypothetical protein
MIIRILTALTVVFCAATAQAQTVADIDKADAAVVAAWEKTPLTIRKVLFVAAPPEGFGMYQPRPNNVFKKGEPLIAYIEPVGFGWKELDEGRYTLGFRVSYKIYLADGKVGIAKDDFVTIQKQSYDRNREFNLVLTSNLDAPPGDYVLEYTLHDVTGDKSTTFKLPFKIAG